MCVAHSALIGLTEATAVFLTDGGVKFFRRGDLMREEEEKRRQEQEKLEREREEARKKKEEVSDRFRPLEAVLAQGRSLDVMSCTI